MVLVLLKFLEPPEKELKLLKPKKIELSENDIHIIDAYSKKNLTDTMPQFGNPGYELWNYESNVAKEKNEKTDGFFK